MVLVLALFPLTLPHLRWPLLLNWYHTQSNYFDGVAITQYHTRAGRYFNLVVRIYIAQEGVGRRNALLT